MNRSPIRYTFCDAPFHYPVQCEHSLKEVKVTEISNENRCEDLIAVELFKFSREERIMSRNISVLLENKV